MSSLRFRCEILMLCRLQKNGSRTFKGQRGDGRISALWPKVKEVL